MNFGINTGILYIPELLTFGNFSFQIFIVIRFKLNTYNSLNEHNQYENELEWTKEDPSDTIKCPLTCEIFRSQNLNILEKENENWK